MKVELLCVVSRHVLPDDPFELRQSGEHTFCFIRPDVALYALQALEIKNVALSPHVTMGEQLQRALTARKRIPGGHWINL